MLVTRGTFLIRRRYYGLINKITQYQKLRWALTCLLVIVYFQRTINLSYDIVTYLIGFYLLQLLISYFTPKGINDDEFNPDQDCTMMLEEDIDISQAGQLFSDEKPLVRALGEIEIWERISFAFFMGIVCTCFKIIQIDVFFPLLCLYFILLVCYTVHQIITKMDKYRYKPSDFFKKPALI